MAKGKRSKKSARARGEGPYDPFGTFANAPGPEMTQRMPEEVPPEKRLWAASGWAIVLEPLLDLVNDEELWKAVHARHAHHERVLARGDARGVRERLRGELEMWMDAVQEAFVQNNPDHALGLWTGALPVMRDARKNAEGKEHLAVLEAAMADARTEHRDAVSFTATRDLLYAFDPLMGEGPYAGPAAMRVALAALSDYGDKTDAEEDAADVAWAEEKVRREGAMEVERARRELAAMDVKPLCESSSSGSSEEEESEEEEDDGEGMSPVPSDAVTDNEVSSDDEEYSDEEDDE